MPCSRCPTTRVWRCSRRWCATVRASSPNCSPTCRRRLRPFPGRRADRRGRGPAAPGKKAEKHDVDVVIDRLKLRCDLHDGSAPAPGRELRGRTGASPRAARSRSRSTPGASTCSAAASRLPGAAIRSPRDGTAAVRSTRRSALLDLRRPGRGHRLRPRPRGRVPEPVARQRRGEGLGPAQRLHLSMPRERGPSLRLRHRRAPFEALPEQARQVLLRGSGATEIAFVYEAEGPSGRKRSVRRSHPFEGIPCRTWKDATKETDSVAIKGEDLARYMAAKPCPDCQGARLRREARHVRSSTLRRPTARPRGRRSTRSSARRCATAWFTSTACA